ncbi:MAG: serine/threonine-protein kinase [Acidobacteriota bacterium]
MQPLPLQRIEGKYEILDKIKEGGMGAIYKVRHRLLDEVRVVKVMRPALSSQDELRERFEREAKTAIKLRHPNIAQLFDLTTDDAGNAFIVMEFIHGLDLRELLRIAGPPPLGLTLELARQSLRAIAYLHRKHFVHRDIAPDNLMLTQDADDRPTIKLIDLGIAKAFEGTSDAALTATGTFLGKLHYASPEQMQVHPLDGRSDLYSFGVVLYELATGQRPIEGDTASALMAGHLFRPPLSFDTTDPGGRVPAALRATIMESLAKSPDDRIPDAETFLTQIEGLQTEYPLSEVDIAWAVEQMHARIEPRGDRVGSGTQQQMDAQFGLEPTPVPSEMTTDPTILSDRTVPTGDLEPTLAAPKGSSPPLEPTVRLPSTAHPTAGATPRRPTVLIAMAALLLAVLVLGFLWLGRDGATEPQTASRSTEAQATAPRMGTLIVRAIPWGRLTTVRDPSGTELPLPDSTYTPLRLELPAGNYELELSRGDDENPQRLTVDIESGRIHQTSALFDEVSIDAFFAAHGW